MDDLEDAIREDERNESARQMTRLGSGTRRTEMGASIDPHDAFRADNQFANKAREIAEARLESATAEVYFSLGYMAGVLDGIEDADGVVKKTLDQRNR